MLCKRSAEYKDAKGIQKYLARQERLPWAHVAFLCMMEGAHFYTVCAIFSGFAPSFLSHVQGFAGVLSADLGWVPDKNEAGFVAGWLQSSNVCGRILTSTIWGFAAARYGPRPVLEPRC